ncbi:hypothetical protein BGW39_006252 [Mortierella sp. 14UC]|nr:hypothetical protein BGW39_006252 [Mortierella sp. 14UC]
MLHTTITPENLENLLSFTPQLKVLKVLNLIAMSSAMDVSYNWPHFLETLQSMALLLEALDFSIGDLSMSPQVKQLHEIGSRLSKWNIQPNSVNGTAAGTGVPNRPPDNAGAFLMTDVAERDVLASSIEAPVKTGGEAGERESRELAHERGFGLDGTLRTERKAKEKETAKCWAVAIKTYQVQ